jgi:uncharacterized protein YkwD
MSHEDFKKMLSRQMATFKADGRVMQTAEGHVTTNEGVEAWREAASVLDTQWKLPALRWSETLALAAQAHCNDQGPSGGIGHQGTDGSSTVDRVKRYGGVG